MVMDNHPYDVKADDLLRIKMLFPENKKVKDAQRVKPGLLYNGCLLEVRFKLFMFLETRDEPRANTGKECS